MSDSHNVTALVVRPKARERALIPNGPRLSHASGELLSAIQITDEYGDHHTIQVPIERPLTVVLDGKEVATLWTLGASAEWLVLGYLWTRQLVNDVTALESITVDWHSGTAAVQTRTDSSEAGVELARRPPPGITDRLGTEVDGLMTPADAFALAKMPAARITRTTLLAVLEGIPEDDAIYRAAGSVHGCALYHGVDLWVSVEDVSRRNAVDTIIGWMALHGVSGADKILFTTGRLTAEIVMKVAQSGIPIIVSRKGVTAICCELAANLGMTLFGHASRRRYICYAGVERFDAQI
jgi:FdhD protein